MRRCQLLISPVDIVNRVTTKLYKHVSMCFNDFSQVARKTFIELSVLLVLRLSDIIRRTPPLCNLSEWLRVHGLDKN